MQVENRAQRSLAMAGKPEADNPVAHLSPTVLAARIFEHGGDGVLQMADEDEVINDAAAGLCWLGVKWSDRARR